MDRKNDTKLTSTNGKHDQKAGKRGSTYSTSKGDESKRISPSIGVGEPSVRQGQWIEVGTGGGIARSHPKPMLERQSVQNHELLVETRDNHSEGWGNEEEMKLDYKS